MSFISMHIILPRFMILKVSLICTTMYCKYILYYHSVGENQFQWPRNGLRTISNSQCLTPLPQYSILRPNMHVWKTLFPHSAVMVFMTLLLHHMTFFLHFWGFGWLKFWQLLHYSINSIRKTYILFYFLIFDL